jgi:hypothetical protein
MASAANFALIMPATTAHGDAYTLAEFQDVFTQGGFLRFQPSRGAVLAEGMATVRSM